MLEVIKENLGWVLFFVGAMATLATNTGRAKRWLAHRAKRQMKLDEILEHSGEITCTTEVRASHEALFHKLSTSLSHVEELLVSVQKHNELQDLEIQKSKEERSILIGACLALLDFMIKQGANGSAHAARDSIKAYLMKEAHK